jgi:hypothetical protein
VRQIDRQRRFGIKETAMKNLLSCTGIISLLFLSSCGKEVTNNPPDDEPAEPSPIGLIARVVPEIDDNEIKFLYSVSEDGGKTWSWYQVFISLCRGVITVAKAGVHAGPRCLDRYSFRFKDGVVYLAFNTIHSYRDNGPDISHFEFYFARSDTGTAPVRITSGQGGLKTIRPDVSEAFIEFHGNSIIYAVQSRGSNGSIPKPRKWHSKDGGKTWKIV